MMDDEDNSVFQLEPKFETATLQEIAQSDLDTLKKDGYCDMEKPDHQNYYAFQSNFCFYYSTQSGILYSLNMMFSPPELRKLIQVEDPEQRANVKLYVNMCTKNLMALDTSTLYPFFMIHVPT